LIFSGEPGLLRFYPIILEKTERMAQRQAGGGGGVQGKSKKVKGKVMQESA
jgi:hypothetical protein